ncbi:16S rRNA (uracil(1498)-N(3))-methyltransferase [Methylobacillus caricis]|uniref:16S rRNA (uracil(1498)-N(3))-methyltransferase n=1 Tax=Methylobacillus caricis TaxID=1971611 RepID=UPI001CFFFD78|nr:16S rRNA (uracil(1498)-N(3))-methyltransferase [Methylobacillus caricis]MCB5188564.1 16S rRNA (uracil(1498)-N(3))-methyltransferase [Methylobacillus caricis]
MSTPRFYCPHPLSPGAHIDLPGNAAVHASRALRMQAGDQAILFNGDGHNYLSEFTSMSKNSVHATILSAAPAETESPLNITLAQAISSGDRMDFTIQKAVEMGVRAIQPIASRRSVIKLSGERAEKRREHWQNVVISACEQSGRATVPLVAMPISLAEWLSQKPDAGTFITLAPGSERVLTDLAPPAGDICFLIGAEGGFTDEEIELAANHGFTTVRMGKRILRTETAALAALAAMQILWGDFGH